MHPHIWKNRKFGVKLNSVYEKELIFKVGIYCHSNLELMGIITDFDLQYGAQECSQASLLNQH